MKLLLDLATYERLCVLLASPDEPEMPPRGSVLKFAGEPNRRTTRWMPLMTRWAAWRALQVDPAPYIGKARPLGWKRMRRVA